MVSIGEFTGRLAALADFFLGETGAARQRIDGRLADYYTVSKGLAAEELIRAVEMAKDDREFPTRGRWKELVATCRNTARTQAANVRQPCRDDGNGCYGGWVVYWYRKPPDPTWYQAARPCAECSPSRADAYRIMQGRVYRRDGSPVGNTILLTRAQLAGDESMPYERKQAEAASTEDVAALIAGKKTERLCMK